MSFCDNLMFFMFNCVLGVLLLNACMTVRESQANSHKDNGWEKFTDATVEWINSHGNNVVFILWGGYAQKKGIRIDKVLFTTVRLSFGNIYYETSIF